MSDKDIIICQNSTRNAGCDGTSGWIWDASRKLEEFLVNDDAYTGVDGLRGLRILELGSGTGSLALRLALRGALVTATDRQGAMDVLVRNISANVDRFRDQHKTDLDVDAQLLDWETTIPIAGEWDLLVGSDLFYIHEHHKSLLETCILHGGGTRCIFAWEERIPEEEERCMTMARQLGFRVDSPVQVDCNPLTKNGIWVVCLTHPGKS